MQKPLINATEKATEQYPSQDLAAINQKILAAGESLPQVRLSNGELVQTGTFATLIHNIKLYDQQVSTAAAPELARQIIAALPTLAKIGLFELFPAPAWQDPQSPGKRLIADYLQS